MINKGKFAVLAVFVVVAASAVTIKLLLASGTGLAPLAPSAATAPAAAQQSARPSLVGEFRGITLQLHSGKADFPYETYIDEIAQTGANTLSLVLAGYQENASSSSIFIDLRKTPGDDRVRQLIKYARSKDLRVIFMPIVLLENAREGEWRGKIAPDNWDAWWEDYASFVFHYAEIASESGVEVFMVGSELVSTEKHTQRWREIIRKVRERFGGRLSYSANWDHYRPIEWWDDLDIVGMTSYYDLTGGEEATVERLTDAWKPIREDILQWQAGINRPLLFTEVGWPNQKTCGQFPWDYYRSTKSPDPQAQSNCFEAFFATWTKEPAVAGYLVWEWQNYPGQNTRPLETPATDDTPAIPADTSYVPAGKPAMEVIRRYFQMPSPNAAPLNQAVAADGEKLSSPPTP